MTSIRRQLATMYVLALAATLVAFGSILYLDRRQSALREIDERLELEATLSIRWLRESYRVLGALTTPAPSFFTPADTVLAIEPTIAAYFEGTQSILLILNRRGNLLFASEEARALRFSAIQELLQLAGGVGGAPPSGSHLLDGGRRDVRYLVRPVEDAGPEIGAILLAASAGTVHFGPPALLRSMLFTLPVILLISLVLGYWLAGRRFEPLLRMSEEVEAITDGRSLHRRLAVSGQDEMARLGIAINRMIARLERSFSSLYRFTADASHELKTPLMVLRAGVERALTHPKTPPEVMQSLDETLEGINWMTELVENLLTLARADEGRAPLALEPVDLREILAEAAETGGMLAEEAGIVVTAESPDRPVVLPVDRNRIRQALLNLVTNAVKYTPAGGRVLLGLAEDEAQVILEVRDTGIGIAPGDVPHVFDRFWRADPARTRMGESAGTGLGLAITKWVAEAHGGTITVQSRPGRGTIFTVTLPRGPGGIGAPAGEGEAGDGDS